MVKHDQVTQSTFKLQSAQVTLHFEEGDTARLTGLFSKEPGRGHASALMTEVMNYADKHELSLYLEVQRFGDPHWGLDNLQLISFYERFGFDLVNDDRRPRWMTREPLERGN